MNGFNTLLDYYDLHSNFNDITVYSFTSLHFLRYHKDDAIRGTRPAWSYRMVGKISRGFSCLFLDTHIDPSKHVSPLFNLLFNSDTLLTCIY